MALFRTLIGQAFRRVASDPRTQEKAKTFVRDEVQPRARDAARQGRETYELLRDDWRETGQDAPPDDSTARRAGRFLGKVHNRLNRDPEA